MFIIRNSKIEWREKFELKFWIKNSKICFKFFKFDRAFRFFSNVAILTIRHIRFNIKYFEIVKKFCLNLTKTLNTRFVRWSNNDNQYNIIQFRIYNFEIIMSIKNVSFNFKLSRFKNFKKKIYRNIQKMKNRKIKMFRAIQFRLRY